MTLWKWLKKFCADPPSNGPIIEAIQREKSKLNSAQDALSRQVDRLKSHHKQSAKISQMVEDALSTFDGNRT